MIFIAHYNKLIILSKHFIKKDLRNLQFLKIMRLINRK